MRLIFLTLDTGGKVALSAYAFCLFLLTLAIVSYLLTVWRDHWWKKQQPKVAKQGGIVYELQYKEELDLLRHLGENPSEYSREELDEVKRLLEIAKSIDVDTNGSNQWG